MRAYRRGCVVREKESLHHGLHVVPGIGWSHRECGECGSADGDRWCGRSDKITSVAMQEVCVHWLLRLLRPWIHHAD